ncbi:MAG: hypothetical protein HY038_01320 [Nitrospirae bacterium]|nr:hypothetical protein [Nitrospirota bacterium]
MIVAIRTLPILPHLSQGLVVAMGSSPASSDTTSQIISHDFGSIGVDKAFIAGWLRDIGLLVLITNFSEQ